MRRQIVNPPGASRHPPAGGDPRELESRHNNDAPPAGGDSQKKHQIPAGGGRECVLLLSGGLDSTTLLAAVTAAGWRVSALTFSYGQKHRDEVQAARRAARAHGTARHVVLPFPLGRVAASALTCDRIAVPRAAAARRGIPATYVPARNLVFLSVAASWAESIGARDLFIGVNRVDYSGYPDCRDVFIRAFERAANSGTRAGTEGRPIRVHAPFIALSKADIVRLGTRLGVDYARTRTCYDPLPDGAACGRCDACALRLQGFRAAGLKDPARYSRRGRSERQPPRRSAPPPRRGGRAKKGLPAHDHAPRRGGHAR